MKKKPKMKKTIQEEIQEEIEKDVEKIFKKMDKLMEDYYGKMCPEFEKDCCQCRANLIYNNFKSRMWEELVKK